MAILRGAGILVLLLEAKGVQADPLPCGEQYDSVARRETIRFKTGETSATVESSVLSRFRDLYEVTARKGQTLTVRIAALEENAVFQICRPDGKKTLAGAGFGEDATQWAGRLPVAGRYTIIVGPTRQSAEYTLSVSIR